MSFYNNEINYESAIQEIYNFLGDEDQLVICTDIQYGSVNQLFVRKLQEWNSTKVFLLSGINLPLVLEIIMTTELISKELLENMIRKSVNQIVYKDHNSFNIIEDNNELF